MLPNTKIHTQAKTLSPTAKRQEVGNKLKHSTLCVKGNNGTVVALTLGPALCPPSPTLFQITKPCTHISSTDKLFGLQKAFGEITYLSFHKDAISVWGVMGATNLIADLKLFISTEGGEE